MNWPWTNVEKMLKKRFEFSKEDTATFITIDELFEHLDSLPPPSIWKVFYWKLNDAAWWVYRYFKPLNNHIRKIIPRDHTEIDSILPKIAFEMVVYYYNNGSQNVVWDYGDRKHCKEWLDKAYNYITNERELLLHAIDSAYPSLGDKTRNYDKVNALEKDLRHRDDEVLLGLIKYREYLWW